MREKIKAREITLRQQPTYQLGKKLYRTKRAAAVTEAWAMICARYCTYVIKLSDVRSVRKMTCECCDGDSNICLIHDRKYGYFARLHKRLVGLLEKEGEV